MFSMFNFGKHKNQNDISFINITDVSKEYYPIPSSHVLPQWYKDMKSYIDDIKKPMGQADTSATIKKCMPVFDALNAGYILVTPADLYITQVEENGNKLLRIESPANDTIAFHAFKQAELHPFAEKDTNLMKWVSPWGIKTPKGYSTLVIPPVHRKLDFTILPGIVDTDKYHAAINFPFVLNDLDFEGLIPAGTPMAQVIPFKRDAWKMNIIEGKEAEQIEQATIKHLRSRFFDSYKNYYRSTKSYT